ATALAAISAASSVPVYGALDALVGRGVVGGFVVDSAGMGRALARMALQIVHGTPVAALPPTEGPPVATFDARQLRRRQIDEERLPSGSVVQFRESSLWQTHRQSVIGAVAVLIGQLVLIAGLLVQRERRRRAEENLRRSEERYRGVVDTQSELICRYTP